jgi:glycosyltransferase involved in cell wall biosynthesis
LVSDGRSGSLVTPDDPEALAQAMRKLFTENTFRGALGDGAREVVKSFEAGRVVAELVGLYEEVCSERLGRSAPCHRSSRWCERRSGQATHR